ncbi:MAG: putative SulP family transporter, partial [bacterium]
MLKNYYLDDSKSEYSKEYSQTEIKEVQKPLDNLKPAYAIKEAFAEGYTLSKLRVDILAGLVVGIVALPLAMALAIASGVPPQYGIYTGIVSGAVTALLGGSRTQVSGPTAAFVVSLAKIGKFIEYIPSTVTTGFTAGIGIVIAVLQLKDFLGLSVKQMPEHFLDRVVVLLAALPSIHWQDLSVGIFTLTILIIWPKVTSKIPSPLIALSIAAIAVFFISKYYPEFSVVTIGSRFSYTINGLQYAGIPKTPPLPLLPWTLPGPDGQAIGLSFQLIRELLPSAFAIAILGAIESLLSAVVADGMSETKHNPDSELFAQGIGNIIGPFFGGFAATGAIARTATNIRSGARSPIASLTHAIFLLLAVLLLASLVSYLPMASLAALLLLVAWNMCEAKHFLHILKVAPRSDILVLVICFLLTVFFDMVIGVTVGLVLSSMLFMHSMAITSNVKIIKQKNLLLSEPLPTDTILYEISGPLFFGAAQKAMSTLNSIGKSAKTVILFIGSVQMIDATGIISLESTLAFLKKHNVHVILTGVGRQPWFVIKKAGLANQKNLTICKSLKHALEYARQLSAKKTTSDNYQEGKKIS